MKRNRNDTVKSGHGIDGDLGEDYTKRSGNPWDSNPRGDYLSAAGAGKYQNKSASFLRNKPANDDPEGGKYILAGDARDILVEVEAQSSDSGNRAVRSGKTD
jgi:hypothetical protein